MVQCRQRNRLFTRARVSICLARSLDQVLGVHNAFKNYRTRKLGIEISPYVSELMREPTASSSSTRPLLAIEYPSTAHSRYAHSSTLAAAAAVSSCIAAE